MTQFSGVLWRVQQIGKWEGSAHTRAYNYVGFHCCL